MTGVFQWEDNSHIILMQLVVSIRCFRFLRPGWLCLKLTGIFFKEIPWVSCWKLLISIENWFARLNFIGTFPHIFKKMDDFPPGFLPEKPETENCPKLVLPMQLPLRWVALELFGIEKPCIWKLWNWTIGPLAETEVCVWVCCFFGGGWVDIHVRENWVKKTWLGKEVYMNVSIYIYI